MAVLSQEVISIAVIAVVCVMLSLSCVLIWFLRCRRDRLQHSRGSEYQEQDIDCYKDKQLNKSFSKQAVADKTVAPKRAESVESDKCPSIDSRRTASKSSLEHKQRGEQRGEDAPPQMEQQVTTQQYVSRPLERIKEETTPMRNKRINTVSASGSLETLQRNDSKVNVFPADKMEEIDLNPGLNSVINLENI